MLFCPTCGNCLLLDSSSQGMLFSCKTCPYVFRITEAVSNKLEFPQKKVDDVIGDEQMWANAETTTIDCEKCQNPKAHFKQVQLRGLDEPSTIFYCCMKCGHRWND